MDIKDNVASGLSFVGETVTELAVSISEKNRLRVRLNHLKSVIKADSATRDQAYIELGRHFYENLRDGASPENEAICAVIDSASERISAASLKYMELLNLQNETKIRSENAEKLKKILAEKAAVAAQTAKEKGAELTQKAKDAAADAVSKARDAAAKAKDAAADLADKAADTVSDVRERIMPEGDIEDILAEEKTRAEETEAPAEVSAEEPAPIDDESPESFDF